LKEVIDAYKKSKISFLEFVYFLYNENGGENMLKKILLIAIAIVTGIGIVFGTVVVSKTFSHGQPAMMLIP
jgi:hypothetical protein